MPASTSDPVTAALRTALTTKNSFQKDPLDAQIAGSSKKALLYHCEYEPAGAHRTPICDKIKSKYFVLKNSESPRPSKPDSNMGADETLKLAKYELYPFEAVQLGWNKCDWSVGAGMMNMGNTCYLNSTLQALFHVPALVNWLISDKQHTMECQDSSGVCIICAMRKTLQDSQNRNSTSIRPILIYNKLRLLCRNLIPGRQEDAHEFLRYLVEAMEKSYLSRFKNHHEFDPKVKETTPLNQILGGYLRSAVRCLKCGHISTTFQHFQDILLDIRKVQTLDEALEGYFSREKLDDESYHCQSCQKKVPATKQFSLERAPMVLCIQLKRFSVSNNKITKHIHFRQRLDITRYARQRPSVPLIYRLVALVTHMGPTVNCGHYTAVAQAPTGNFYQFDDSMVRVIPHQTVFNTNAYIMLYELESSPFSQKSSTITNKTKSSVSPETICSNLAPKTSNGIGFTSDKVYGPELPPNKTEKQTNGSSPLVNGISDNVKQPERSNGNVITNGTNTQKENKSFTIKKTPTITNNIEVKSTNLQSSQKQGSSVPEQTVQPKETKVQTVATKLVPYETDDSSCSEESSQSIEEKVCKVATKASVNNWKVTPADHLAQTKNWMEKKKDSTVNELLKMSHNGYSAPVSSWNGTRAHLDKEVSNERREERKRMLNENSEQQYKAKHQKLNNSHKSNPGYNPIQEFHNAKNWSNGSGHYNKQFYRHRRNFHHNKGFHKNFRFRHSS